MEWAIGSLNKTNVNYLLMKISFVSLVLALLGGMIQGQDSNQKDPYRDEFVLENYSFAEKQYDLLLRDADREGAIPKTTGKEGNLRFARGSGDWTRGFFAGSLWYLHEFTGKEKWKEAALRYSQMVEPYKYNRASHDVGFVINNSFGHAHRLNPQLEYKAVIVQAAKSLISRYHPKVGCIRSWGTGRQKTRGRWQFPVIIENMMNLEILFYASSLSGDRLFHRIAVKHARKTMRDHYRKDHSAYDLVNYDKRRGKRLFRGTAQGHADESVWARGQSSGLYGFIVTYRFTGKKPFLKHAERIASFLLNHKNRPEDFIPYWDYESPDIPDTLRDTSAAAIMASALYELSSYVEDGAEYKKKADAILESLASTNYRAQLGENNHFILMHSAGDFSGNVKRDVPLNGTDYYFLEALLRKKTQKEKGNLESVLRR